MGVYEPPCDLCIRSERFYPNAPQCSGGCLGLPRSESMGEYEDEFPAAEGPFKVPTWAKERTEPTFTVELDYSTFRRIWEMLESEGRFRWPVRDALSNVRALLRGVTAFRKAWQEQAPPEDLKVPQQVPRRTLNRSASTPPRKLVRRAR